MAKRKVPRPGLYWRLRVLMAERGVRDAPALYEMLVPFGYRKSVSQLRRTIHELPENINSELLGMLCAAFNVETNEIVTRLPSPAVARKPKLVGTATSSPTPEEVERLLGPPTPALPKGKFSAR